MFVPDSNRKMQRFDIKGYDHTHLLFLNKNLATNILCNIPYACILTAIFLYTQVKVSKRIRMVYSQFDKCPAKTNEPRHEISNNVVCATSKASDQPAHTHSLIRAFAICLDTL